VLEGLEANHARRTAALDAPYGTEDDTLALVDVLGSAEPGYERVESTLAVAQLAALDEREVRVLRMRFGEALTQREVASRFGVSQMQISRVQRRALWKLLNAVQGEATDSPVPARQGPG
jgi:RNA polymerase sigma-B factor